MIPSETCSQFCGLGLVAQVECQQTTAKYSKSQKCLPKIEYDNDISRVDTTLLDPGGRSSPGNTGLTTAPDLHSPAAYTVTGARSLCPEVCALVFVEY